MEFEKVYANDVVDRYRWIPCVNHAAENGFKTRFIKIFKYDMYLLII